MNPETTLEHVRALSEGHQTRHHAPRRRTPYVLTRPDGQPVRRLEDVTNHKALPLGLRLLFSPKIINLKPKHR